MKNETGFPNKVPHVIAVAALLVLLGCGSTTTTTPAGSSTRPVRADDMSAEEHRTEAEWHEGAARSYLGRANPAYPGEGAAPYADRVSGRQDFAAETSSGLPVTRSREHAKHAMQHRRAAELLETFEEAECAMSHGQDRALCPLLVDVARIDELPMGVRLHLMEGVDVERVVNHMRCHHAFGKARGFEDMETCPLYLKRIRIRKVDAQVVELTSDSKSSAREIQRRARDHAGPSAQAVEAP